MRTFTEFLEESAEMLDEGRSIQQQQKSAHRRKLMRQFRQFLDEYDDVERIVIFAELGGSRLKLG